MTSENYLRLRQICLATLDLKGTEETLSKILGLTVCHRSTLENFGLENIMFAVNGVFIEVVAPIRAETAVHRFLARNNGLGGYMAIFDCARVADHREAALANGIDPVYERNSDEADLLQLNPKQTGATMMEFDHHYGDDRMLGHYEWAGNDWHKHVDTRVTKDILGIEITSPKAALRAELWAKLCLRPTSSGEAGLTDIKLDYGTLTFRQTESGSPEMLRAMDITVTDRQKTLATAESEGCNLSHSSFTCCGMEFRVHTAT
jgi:hypothetical protein